MGRASPAGPPPVAGPSTTLFCLDIRLRLCLKDGSLAKRKHPPYNKRRKHPLSLPGYQRKGRSQCPPPSLTRRAHKRPPIFPGDHRGRFAATSRTPLSCCLSSSPPSSWWYSTQP